VLRQKLGLVLVAALAGLCANGCYGTGGYETGTTAYYSSPAVEVVEVRTTTPVYRRSRPHRYGHSRHYSTGKHYRPAQTTRTGYRDTGRKPTTTRTPNRANLMAAWLGTARLRRIRSANIRYKLFGCLVHTYLRSSWIIRPFVYVNNEIELCLVSSSGGAGSLRLVGPPPQRQHSKNIGMRAASFWSIRRQALRSASANPHIVVTPGRKS